MRATQAPGTVGVGRSGGLRTVGVVVLFLAVGLVALAAVLSTISPLRLDLLLFAGSAVVGAVLSLGLILIGRNRLLPALTGLSQSPEPKTY